MAAVVGIGFLAAGLKMYYLILPHDWWRALAIASSVVSLLLCLLFWITYLIAGPVVPVRIIVMLTFVRRPTEATLGY